MVTTHRALNGFKSMKDDELVITVQTIVRAMDGNTHFATPSPTLEDVQTQLDDFTAKLAAVRKRGAPEDTALKNESRVILVDTMAKLSYYVNLTANGVLSVLLSSGFPTNPLPAAAQPPVKVVGVRLLDTNQSGQVRLQFQMQKRVRIYEYQYAKAADPENWSERQSTTDSRITIIAPLEPGIRYFFQVRAVNQHGAGDWSDSASIIVR
ncbi:fibronectin type III domain-containing protein [Sphingobacterium olei]|uniref:Fibronectin type III domain-containing protein n=1 Tax=Sphingobacterium olei TaxID=2571155 RepID=A0A4U0P7H9_9SPHI|nr:fibronectin type III domain-containing protein [Sphingobacterium olei]TJZ63329.1 fibronectin type III domain-containing protein [Sphingobacterium olei]